VEEPHFLRLHLIVYNVFVLLLFLDLSLFVSSRFCWLYYTDLLETIRENWHSTKRPGENRKCFRSVPLGTCCS